MAFSLVPSLVCAVANVSLGNVMDSLFDNIDEDAEISEWQEVPQARFLSWSPEMQRSYCAARDLDSAAREEDLWWAEFFLERAKSYKS